jgi:hypothetical protein
MKKMSRVEKAILTFMAGTAGRWARGLGGVALIALAIVSGGWWLLLAIPGVMMVITGIMNYCPAGLFVTGSGKSEDIMANIAKYDALDSQVSKH